MARIDIELGDNETIVAKKLPADPPRSSEEAEYVLDVLYDINKVLGLTCRMQSLTGLRYSDASYLKYSDFYDADGLFRSRFNLIQQKTYRMRLKRFELKHERLATKAEKQMLARKSRVCVYTNKAIRNIVDEAAILNPPDLRSYLFENKRSKGKPMTVESANEHHRNVKRELHLEGINLSTHSWRKYFSATFLASGGSIYELRDLLGHSDIKSTDKYLMSFSDRLKKLIENLGGQNPL
ncbi:tyrosine-type recombinase/integrase (plasmid) [Vibrio scophthalmi]|uniref:tyrosine-type recombinase/integrase n=1 Tax=Vibrio scophthalmi TaxID=45658 RepID=UPI003EBC8887